MNKVLTTILLVIIALVLLVAGFLGVLALTPWGQQFVTRQVNSYLAKKIKSPFRIGRIRYDIPDWLQLDDVYFVTPQGDTLLSGQRMRVDIDMLGLLNNRVAINQIELERIRVNVTRTLPDTAFNFQYIIDAFNTGKPEDPTKAQAADTTATPLDINLSGITLKDTRVIYRDDVTGIDANVFLDSLRAEFDRVNVDRSQYYVKTLNVDGLNARTRVYEGLPTPDEPDDPAADTLDIGLGAWKINRAQWDVAVETADFRTKGSVGRLNVETNHFYLNGQSVSLRSLLLENSDISATLTKPTRRRSTTSADAQTDTTTSAGWQAFLGQLQLTNNRIRFDDETAPRLRRGLDYGHLDLRDLGLTGRQLVYQPNRIAGQFRDGRFREKSGFVLQRLDGDVLYSDKQTSVTRLFVQTPRTLLRDAVVLRYDSLAQLSNPRLASRVGVRVNLRQSTLAFSDLLLLAPDLATQLPPELARSGVIRANAQLRGTLARLNIPTLDVAMLSGTRLRARGLLTNVTDTDRLGLDLTIQQATTRRSDLQKLLPRGTLPSTISLPDQLALTGRLRGQLNNLSIRSALRTNWGNAAFDGTLRNFVTGRGQAYAGTLTLQNVNAGRWIQQPQTVGEISGSATVNGRGLDLNTMRTTFRLNVAEATLQGYRYQQLFAQGVLSQGVLNIEGSLNDPNAKLAIDTRVGLKSEYPTIQGTVNLTELDLNKLKLYSEPLTLRGRIALNMRSTDPAQPRGTIFAEDASVVYGGKTYPIDSLYLRADTQGPRKLVTVRAPFAQLNLNGLFEYTRLGDIIIGEVARYVQVPGVTYKTVPPPYDFNIRAKVYQHPLLKAFVPQLTRLDTVRLNAYLDNVQDTTFLATLTTGVIEYDTSVVRNATLNLRAYDSLLTINGRVNGATYSGYNIGQTLLTGTARDNVFGFNVVSKDSVGQDRHGIAGRLATGGGNYRLQLARNGLLTNYRAWTVVDTTGYVLYGPSGVLVERLALQSRGQTLTVNSVFAGSATRPVGGSVSPPNAGLPVATTSGTPPPNSPIRVTAQNVSLSDLAQLANQDTTLVGGTLNGDVTVRDYFTNLSFTGNVTVDSLEVMEKPIGTLRAQFLNAPTPGTPVGRVGVDAELASALNRVRLNGFYNASDPKQALDFEVDLERLDARTIEAFSFGELRSARGALKGRFSVDGATTSPQLNGGVRFDSVAFNIKQLNATYRFDQEEIGLDGQTIRFRDFAVRDTLGRTLTTNGTVSLVNIPDVSYNLSVAADNFLVLNAARKDNDYAYGRAAVSANLRIRGVGTTPSVTGNIKLEDGSDINVVLPDESLDVNDARQTVTFIDHRDTLALNKYLVRPRPDTTLPKLSFEELANANINLSLSATEKSEITIVIDELNGDNLRAQGNANLNVSIAADGTIQVLGRYEVTEGEYSLTYEVLRRQFEIQRGGSITFTGDPLKADVNLTAVYRANTAPENLVANESSSQLPAEFKQRLPFDVLLKIQGNLAAPQLSFDINLANQENLVTSRRVVDAVNDKLRVIRDNPSEINKQVFALLVLGNFIAENSSNFFSGGSGGGTALAAENLARNSVSKILSDQLDRFASNLIKGVDVDFNLVSANEFNAAGTRGARTDLNVGLSKNFLNGRLSVVVGRNFVLENNSGLTRNPSEVFDNVSLNYNLSRDGRYVVRGYRKNEFETVLEGFIVETGIGFVITVDYNTLNELFRRNVANK